MKKKWIALSLIIASIAWYMMLHKPSPYPAINFYDLTFLRNPQAVAQVLRDKGFVEVDITTKDGLSINTVMIDKSDHLNVQATIISMPGFFPGRKEGMTTLHAMLEDQPYNFMFIDARGHGSSDGELFTYNAIKHYGQLQYLDVVAAIEYIYDYNREHNIPPVIIIHGLCSGAFHTIQAMSYLKQHNLHAYESVRGLILDSAWPSIASIAANVAKAEAAERCHQYHLPFLAPVATAMILTVYNLCFKQHHDRQKSVVDMISSIKQPILFIHAADDQFVPASVIEPLVTNCNQADVWLVENSSHVNSHLLHPQAYTEKMQKFIQSVMTPA